jgi:pyruvate formate lyase activating enzyme
MAHRIAKQVGLSHVYTGNVIDPQRQNTYCPGCGKLLIERRGYDVSRFHITHNRCLFCEREIAGFFDDTPGSWDGRYQRVDPSQVMRMLRAGNA